MARKILSSQLELLKPDILESWREAAVNFRSKATHMTLGGDNAPGPSKDKHVDFDIGLRSGKPVAAVCELIDQICLSEEQARKVRERYLAYLGLGCD